MKQLYYLLTAAALLLAGCHKSSFEAAADVEVDQLTVNASVDGVPVAQTLQAQSRAANVDVNLTTYGFYLAGYHTTGKMATAVADAYPNVFNKEATDNQAAVPLVTYVDNKFTLKTIKWLLDDVTYLSFFGWSQSKTIPTITDVTGATTGIIGQTTDGNDKGYPWIDIRNADAPADQTDVVGSRSLDHKNDAVVSAVDLDFRHLLTKLTFKAKSTSGANVTITTVNIKYATDKVRKKARYTFGSEATAIGAYSDFAEYHNGTVALNATYPAVTNGAEALLGSALLLPQTLGAGDISLEITYKISPNGALAGPELTKTLPLPAFAFQQGNNYAYAIDIQATEISVSSHPLILDWDVVAAPLPLVAGPADGKTLLLLNGYDKPYIHTDGKAYWLDQSGYNNHCEIVGYVSSMYSATDHTYTFANSPTRYLQVPSLQSVTALTVSVVAQQKPGAYGSQNLINMDNGTSNTRPFFTHLGYNGSTTIYFDTGNNTGTSGRLMHNVSVNWQFDQRTLWTFQKQDGGVQNIYRNASLEQTTATTSSTVALSTLNGKIGAEYAGQVSYVKMVGAIQSKAEIEADLQDCKMKFDIAFHKANPPRADQIQTINGVKWTIGNLVGVDGMNCMVGEPSDNGLYFRTSSLVGLTGGASGDGKGASVNNSVFNIYCKPDGYSVKVPTWADVKFAYNPMVTAIDEPTGMGDPCTYYLGSPWRIPTLDDFKSLTVYSPWTTNSGMNGNFGGTISSGWNTTNSIFFPAAGRRNSATGLQERTGSEGAYLSSNYKSGFNNHGLWVRSGYVASLDSWDCNRAYPVRCVSK